MKALVFLGPSLSREAAREILPDAVYLPPAAQGDIASVCRVRPPLAIGIIDGEFRQSLSIWHKEILFALGLGCRVLGASSMGALRAVECEPWGAEPVGAIAQWVREEIVSDADVALAHGSAEHGYRALSVPLVNVIATLERAGANGALTPERGEEILAAARTIFYEERRWPLIAKAARCSKAEREAMTNYLVDQKAIDAELLLRSMEQGARSTEPEAAPGSRLPARHVFESFGRVLQDCDVRIPCPDRRPRRAWEIAALNAWCADAAADRGLAIELARSLGLEADLPDKISNDALAARLDMLPHEYDRFAREELLLARARLWLRCVQSGHDETPRRLNYLRAAGLYAQAKAGLNSEVRSKK